jgi:hypothetical protein
MMVAVVVVQAPDLEPFRLQQESTTTIHHLLATGLDSNTMHTKMMHPTPRCLSGAPAGNTPERCSIIHLHHHHHPHQHLILIHLINATTMSPSIERRRVTTTPTVPH